MAPGPTGEEPDEVYLVSERERTEGLAEDLVGFLGRSSYDAFQPGIMSNGSNGKKNIIAYSV